MNKLQRQQHLLWKKRLRGIEKLSKLAQEIHYEISQKMEMLNIRYNIHNY